MATGRVITEVIDEVETYFRIKRENRADYNCEGAY